MSRLSLFGLFAVTAMLVSYALEHRSSWFILAFAVACALGSAYGFLQGGLAVWSGRSRLVCGCSVPLVAGKEVRNCQMDCPVSGGRLAIWRRRTPSGAVRLQRRGPRANGYYRCPSRVVANCAESGSAGLQNR